MIVTTLPLKLSHITDFAQAHIKQTPLEKLEILLRIDNRPIFQYVLSMITPKKWLQLKKQMDAAGIFESDLDEKFIIGSGSGGQNLHKTASTVYLKHLPSGLEVKCQISRLRDENRFYARRRLFEKFTEKILQEESKRQQEIAKIRRQKRRRSRKAKQKMLDEKKQRSETKTLRKPPID